MAAPSRGQYLCPPGAMPGHLADLPAAIEVVIVQDSHTRQAAWAARRQGEYRSGSAYDALTALQDSLLTADHYVTGEHGRVRLHASEQLSGAAIAATAGTRLQIIPVASPGPAVREDLVTHYPWTDQILAPRPSRSAPLRVATAVSRSRGGTRAWAWVTDSGRHGVGLMLPNTPLADVEYHGIRRAVRAMTPEQRRQATVLVSRKTAARRWCLRTHSWESSDEVKVRWVPSRSGDPLQEASFRLARLACRCAVAGVGFNQDVAANIVDELTQKLCAAELVNRAS